MKLLKKQASKYDYPIVALSDKQAVLISGKTKKNIGVGPKYIFNANEI